MPLNKKVTDLIYSEISNLKFQLSQINSDDYAIQMTVIAFSESVVCHF